jgi:hypothetical protein
MATLYLLLLIRIAKRLGINPNLGQNIIANYDNRGKRQLPLKIKN